MYIPIAIVVLSNVFYHICTKSTPDNLNPYASLTVTYLVGAVFAAVLYFIAGGSNIFAEYRNLNWTSFVLGFSIVGLEAGFIYMYKAGWDMSTGQLVASALLAICLIFVGYIFYKEQFTITKIAGIVICMVGLFFINK